MSPIDAVVAVLFSFPTVLYTALLGLVTLYWVLVTAGAVDIDAFGGSDGGADAALEGGAHALDGGTHAALDGAVEGAADGALDGAVEGAADGALDGVAEGAAEGAHAAGAELVPHASGPLELLGALRLRSAPVTVVGSFFTLWGWVGTALGEQGLQALLGNPGWLARAGLLVASVPVSLVLTSLTVRPMAPLFAHGRGLTNRDLLGHTCEVNTLRVDQGFGRAALMVDGQDLLIEVRCDRPDNGLSKGAQVLIISHDPRREAFVVEPMRDRVG